MTLLAGIRRRDPSVIVNGVVSFVFAAMPRALETRYGARFRPWQRLWISTAAFVHYGRLDAIGGLILDLIEVGLVIRFGQHTLSNVADSVTDE